MIKHAGNKNKKQPVYTSLKHTWWLINQKVNE